MNTIFKEFGLQSTINLIGDVDRPRPPQARPSISADITPTLDAACALRKIQKPRPHAIMRNHATRLRGRIGFGDRPPQRFEFGVIQIRVQFGRIDHAGMLVRVRLKCERGRSTVPVPMTNGIRMTVQYSRDSDDRRQIGIDGAANDYLPYVQST